MEKIEICIRCDTKNYELIKNTIKEALMYICPFLEGEKPSYCGEYADCSVCMDDNVTFSICNGC